MTESKWLLNLCVPTLRVADVRYNLEQILSLSQGISASSKRAQLCLFPQLALSSNTCGDLFFQPLLAQTCLQALEKMEDAIADTRLIVVVGLPLLLANHLYDAAAIIDPQGLRGFVLNHQPDCRFFTTPNDGTPSNLAWKDLQVQIFDEGSLELPALDGKRTKIVVGKLSEVMHVTDESLILNPTALPALVDSSYEGQFHQLSRQNQGLLAVCSAGASESTGEQVFSGLSQVWLNGKLLTQDCEPSFDSKVFQINPLATLPELHWAKNAQRDPQLPFLLIEDQDCQLKNALEIQTTALLGRMQHTNSGKLVLGISGGADSSMAFLVCLHALTRLRLPRENLIAVSMPGPGSSANSIKNLRKLAKLAKIKPRVIPISEALREHLSNIGHDGHTANVTYENAQARERTQILMNIANMHNGLVVGTGDLSEIALGWSTYNGDQMSMYNVNAGLPKTVLLRLLVWTANSFFGDEGRKVAQKIVNSPISPELKPLDASGELSQSTEEVLGPYLLHDFFLWHIVRERKNPQDVFEGAVRVFNGEYQPAFILKTLKTFYQRFFVHQFKRTAAPDGPQLFSLSLSPRSGWRMPADASPALWLEQLEQIEKSLQASEDS